MFKFLLSARVGKTEELYEWSDFETPPNVIEKAVDALRSGETHYTSSSGLQSFQKWRRLGPWARGVFGQS